MIRTPLKEWVEAKSQTELSRLTGFTQGGIRKMIIADRKIFVIEQDENIQLEENKKLIPAKKNQPAA